MREAILEYLRSPGCKMDAHLFVETAYWRKFDKIIPAGALQEAVAQLSRSEGGALPGYLTEFFLYVRAGSRSV